MKYWDLHYWKLEVKDCRYEWHEIEGGFIWGKDVEEAKQNVLKTDSRAIFCETEEELGNYEKARREYYEYYKRTIG